MEREASLERSRAQLEVDWQRRCEDTEREVYSKQEQLITGLTKQRDEVNVQSLVGFLEKWIKATTTAISSDSEPGISLFYLV